MSIKRATRREENADATVEALLRAATRAFAAKGYQQVTLGEICEAARVTTGALYHHFADKKALFQAVAEEITIGLVHRAVSEVEQVKDPWERLCRGIDVVLESSAGPEVKLAFLEAPAVLGLEEWRQIEVRHTGPLMQGVLEGLVVSGELTPAKAMLLATTVRGLMLEGAMAVAESKDPESTRVGLSQMIRTMVMSQAPRRSTS